MSSKEPHFRHHNMSIELNCFGKKTDEKCICLQAIQAAINPKQWEKPLLYIFYTQIFIPDTLKKNTRKLQPCLCTATLSISWAVVSRICHDGFKDSAGCLAAIANGQQLLPHAGNCEMRVEHSAFAEEDA